MTASFIAYIDESGDEGFKFLPNETGSSRWFVISAVIFRQSNGRAPIEALKRAREALGKEPRQALHFKDLRHEARVAYVAEVAKENMRCVSVLVHKPSLPDPERYQSNKFLLYKYVTRLLLERVSWLCRDTRKANEGDGEVELVFSDRAAMSYTSLRDYLKLLKEQASFNDAVRIDWSVISPNRVRAVAHSKLAGLQMADAVASSHFWAVKLSVYGHCEPRYAQALAKRAYCHKDTKIGYGFKFWPNLPGLKVQMPHLAAFEGW